MADDRWRDDNRRRWDEERNRYGNQSQSEQSYGSGEFGQDEPYYERPENQSRWDDRSGFARSRGGGRFGERGRYGESGYGGQGERGYGSQGGYGQRFGRGYGEGGWTGRSSQDYGSGSYGSQSGYGSGGYGGSQGGYGQGGRGYGGYGGSQGGYGQRYGRGGYGENWSGEGNWSRGGDNDRGFWDRASDEVSSWFGDEDAESRRRMDRARGGKFGKGPQGYSRSDDRIREDVNDRLTDDWFLDATSISVQVKDGEVTLDGTVDSRDDKRRAEDVAENVSGVKHVQNNLRVQSTSESGAGKTSMTGRSSTSGLSGSESSANQSGSSSGLGTSTSSRSKST
jgi:osmotically-inducible protein OsmY